MGLIRVACDRPIHGPHTSVQQQDALNVNPANTGGIDPFWCALWTRLCVRLCTAEMILNFATTRTLCWPLQDGGPATLVHSWSCILTHCTILSLQKRFRGTEVATPSVDAGPQGILFCRNRLHWHAGPNSSRLRNQLPLVCTGPWYTRPRQFSDLGTAFVLRVDCCLNSDLSLCSHNV